MIPIHDPLAHSFIHPLMYLPTTATVSTLQDNIALCALLETVKTGELIFVCNLHLTWDPLFKDVKVIQMALALTQMEAFLRDNGCPECVLREGGRSRKRAVPGGCSVRIGCCTWCCLR